MRQGAEGHRRDGTQQTPFSKYARVRTGRTVCNHQHAPQLELLRPRRLAELGVLLLVLLPVRPPPPELPVLDEPLL